MLFLLLICSLYAPFSSFLICSQQQAKNLLSFLKRSIFPFVEANLPRIVPLITAIVCSMMPLCFSESRLLFKKR